MPNTTTKLDPTTKLAPLGGSYKQLLFGWVFQLERNLKENPQWLPIQLLPILGRRQKPLVFSHVFRYLG